MYTFTMEYCKLLESERGMATMLRFYMSSIQ